MPILRITYTRPSPGLPPPQDLARRLTEVVLEHHDLSKWSDQLRTMFRVTLHEVSRDRFLTGGEDAALPIYDIEYVVPAETLTPRVRDAVADGIARCVLEWEGRPWDADDAMRIVLFITDVPHDRWFWGGRAVTPRAILGYLGRLRFAGRKPRAVPRLAEAREPA